MSLRDDVVDFARSRIGSGPEGEFFESALGSVPHGRLEWCGIFTLWCLHEAGLATDVRWKIGTGYVYRLPKTKDPQPGDIAVFEHFWHHAVVEEVARDDDGKLTELTTIDGNAGNPPGEVAREVRKLPHKGLTFYSIEPLIASAG